MHLQMYTLISSIFVVQINNMFPSGQCVRSHTLTCFAKFNTFLVLEFKIEAILGTVAMHLQMYTLISSIFVVQINNMFPSGLYIQQNN